jgi:hypothetical protein
MTEIVVPITVTTPTSGLLRELNVLLESQFSEAPLSLERTTLTELRLDGDGWSPAVAAAAAGLAAETGGRKQPHHYYVAIHITATE